MIRRLEQKVTSILAVLGVLILMQSEAMACGSIGKWIAEYERGDRHKALFPMLDCSDSYKVPTDDFALMPIIKDALQREAEIFQMAAQVFKNYNHLWAARKDPAYAQILQKVTGQSDFRELTLYQNWYYVTAQSGAYLRKKPSLNGKVVTAVKFGMQVRAESTVGDWIKCRPVGPGSVDPRFEFKKGYIHKSLLKPY
jgi:hypothetical protein